MYNITLVLTNHSELGKCNSEELHNIIESINPEIIFVELPKDIFDKVYNGNQPTYESLETKAVKRYLLKHATKPVPVDIDANPNLSTKEIEDMFRSFKKYDVYKKLEEEQNSLTGRDGFSFLNRKKCKELFEKKKATERSLMEFMTNKIQLSRIHNMFYEEQDQREHEIIKNIYNYSTENEFNQALLLIGAGHGKSVIEKIEKYKAGPNVKLNWIFYGR
jgi:pheromone shutdown protein TraB